MADFPSRDELRRTWLVAALNPPGGVRPQITRAAIETPGTDMSSIREGAAACGDEVAGSTTSAVASWWIDSAQDEQLDKRVLDVIGLVRHDAGVSRGTVQFRLTTALVADLLIPRGTTLSTPDGIEFVTTLAATFPKATVGPLSVPVRSARAGSTVLAAIGSINSIASVIPGAPADLVVTNELATSPGTDAETDPSLRSAYRNYFRTATKGTLAALEEGAKRYRDPANGGGVIAATALEYYDLLGRQTKQVLLAIADQYTDQYVQTNSVPPTYAARSQALAGEVLAFLRDVRAGGIYVGVFVCRVILQPVELVLTFTAGADPFEVSVAARSAMVNYINALPPGAAFIRSAAADALRIVPGVVVTGREIAYPPGDIVPRVLEKLGTDLRFVTANSTAVDKPLPTLYSADGYIVGG
jgi:hypothetical protein